METTEGWFIWHVSCGLNRKVINRREMKTMSGGIPNIDGKNISVKVAAEILGMSQQFVRIGLQRGILPFGSAVKLSSKWTYYVSLARLYEYAGVKRESA